MTVEVVRVARSWGTILHVGNETWLYGPWGSKWAAESCARLLRQGLYLPDDRRRNGGAAVVE